MTEIGFIINLMMNYNLSEEVKKLCLERIAEIESRIIQNAQTRYVQPQPFQPPVSAAQARFEAETQEEQSSIVIPKTPLIPMREQLKEQVIQSSNGTSLRGPNKMRGQLK